jgi:hypothetical protein
MSQKDLPEEEEYSQSPPKDSPLSDSEPKKSNIKGKPKRDKKDLIIGRLKNVNLKLRQHLKELNNKLEVAIDNTHTVKKPAMPAKEVKPEEEAMRVDSIKKCIGNIKIS